MLKRRKEIQIIDDFLDNKFETRTLNTFLLDCKSFIVLDQP